MAGLRYVKSLIGHNTAALERFIVTNGETITKGDLVRLTDGYATICTGGTSVLGVANETVVGNGVKTVEVNVDPYAVYEITADNVGTTTAQAHMGTYHDVTGTTGAVLLDSSTTGATGELLALKLDGTKVMVALAEKQTNL